MDLREKNKRQLLGEIARQQVQLEAFPMELHVGLSTLCNLNCSFCPFKGFSCKPVVPAKILPLSLIEKLSPCFPFVTYFSPSVQGEPFLYPHFDELVKLARENGLLSVTHLTNNATQLGNYDLKKLEGTNIVAFSVDGGTKELFELLRYGADFDQVVDNVRKLRATLPNTVLQFSVEVNRLNVAHLVDIYLLARQLNINYLVFNAVYGHQEDPVIQLLRLRDSDKRIYTGQLKQIDVENKDQTVTIIDYVRLDPFEDGAPLDEDDIRKQLWALKDQEPFLDYETFRESDPSYYQISPSLGRPDSTGIGRAALPYCTAPFTTINVGPDGRVRPCCAQFADIDDLTDKSMDEVWNGKAFINLREAMFEYARIPNACRDCEAFVRYVNVDELVEQMVSLGIGIEDIEIPPNYNPPKDAIKNEQLLNRIKQKKEPWYMMQGLSDNGIPTAETWDKVAADYAIEVDSGEAELAKEIVELLERHGIRPGSHLLEIGSGSGHLSACLAMAGYHTALLDFSPEALERSRQTYAHYQLEGEFIQGDILALEEVLADAHYDLLWNSGVMEHFADDTVLRAFQNIAKLKSDQLLVLVPNPNSISYLLMRYIRMATGDWPYGKEYLRHDYDKIISAAGYGNIEISYFATGATEYNFWRAMQGAPYADAYTDLLNRGLLPEGEKYMVGYFACKDIGGAPIWKIDESTSQISLADSETQFFDLNAERYGLVKQVAEQRENIARLHEDIERLNGELNKKTAEEQALQGELTMLANQSRAAAEAAARREAQIGEAIQENQATIASAKGMLFQMMGSSTFKIVHLWARFKYQFLKGGATEKKAFFHWLRHRNSIGDGSGQVYNPLKRVYNVLDAVNTIALPEQDGLANLAMDELARPYQEYDVIILGVIDYDFRYQRPQHFAAHFANKGHRVVYINANFAAQSTLQKQGDNLYVVSLKNNQHGAIYHTDWITDPDSLHQGLDEVMDQLCIRDALVLVDYPHWLLAARHFHRTYGFTVVTDYMDDFTGFINTASSELAENSKKLLSESDGVVASSQFLHDIVTQYNSRVALVRNGTEAALFETAFLEDIPDKSRKVIGYYGAISDWFDAEKVCYLAQKMPECDVVLIGEVTAHKKRLEQYSNVQLLGEKPYGELPQFLADFDVCLIPFDTSTDLIKATNPVKFYEYLSAGKKVVATEIPELEPYRDKYAYLANNDEDFAEYVRLCLNGEDELESPEMRRQLGRDNDWAVRYGQMKDFAESLFPKVSIIVLTYNNLSYTKACVDSILNKTAWPAYELIIVDNASTDGTRDYLSRFEGDSQVKVILNPENSGFAAGNNIGIRQATGDYIVLLNNDTLVTRGWLSALVKPMQADTRLGMCGPVTNSIGNEAKITASYHSLQELDWFAEINARRNLGKVTPCANALAMFCVCIRRKIIEECGLLDERYSTGMFEDDDYAMAVRSKGYMLGIVEDSFVHHFDGASFSKIQTDAHRQLFEKNKRLFEEKWGCRWMPHEYRPGVGWETDSDLKHELEAES